jgi:cation-transporting ATPase E
MTAIPTPAGATPAARVSLGGLTEAEAAARRARGQGNDVHIQSGRTYARILRENVFTVVNVLLFSIGLLLLALGLVGDAAVTAVLVVVNVFIGLFQEIRAKRSLDKLALLTRPTAQVIRDGVERTIDPTEAVLGDFLVVRRGDQLVLDGTVRDGRMEVDESLLTGEADRIPKAPGDAVLSGSFCVTGTATFEATKVGAESFVNQLTAGARAFKEERTPLQRDVVRVMRAIAILVAMTAVPVAISFWRQFATFPAIDTVRAAAVLVALVPQGLIVMVTVTYALGAVRLADNSALIQRANAIERMSRVDLLCLDKTGTLTTPLIELAEIRALAVDDAELKEMIGAFVTSATLATRSADAIRAAFPAAARPISDEVTFSSELRWSGVCFSEGDRIGAYVMGAPEVIRPHLRPGPTTDVIEDQLAAWAAQGLRVMVFARRAEVVPLRRGDEACLPDDMEPLGIVALREQLRADARETLARFATAGVDLKLISGDNPATVAALALQVGLDAGGKVISGLELESMDDAALADAASNVRVFGRVPPSLKARLVEALRGRGYYIAMVGDGVNDVLSLKQAHLGISMQSGSQATRAVADIVLLNDSFAALPEAVLEGQRIITGMQDSLHLFLARAFYMAIAIFGVAVLGLTFPVTPKHNTVLALLTVGIPTLALAVWARPGVVARNSLLRTLRTIVPPAVTAGTLAILVFWWYQRGGDLQLARTAFTTFAIFCGLALIPLLEPPVGESFSGADRDGSDWRPAMLALAMLAAYALCFLIPPARDFFELTPIPLADAAIIAAVAGLWSLVVILFWRVRMFDRVALTWRRATG